MNSLKEYILEKYKIKKDTTVKKSPNSEEEIIQDSIDLVNKYLKENTSYKISYEEDKEEPDYKIEIKNDYLFLIIYGANINELKNIGSDIRKILWDNNLHAYGDYELGSNNRTYSRKKLIFHLNIERTISREDFDKVTFKRTKRF